MAYAVQQKKVANDGRSNCCFQCTDNELPGSLLIAQPLTLETSVHKSNDVSARTTKLSSVYLKGATLVTYSDDE